VALDTAKAALSDAVNRLVDPLARTAFRGAYSLARVYWFALRPVTEGVCVALWHGRGVLLIQNSYKRAFALPGGGRHRGEAWLDAAVRELREEVGVHLPPESLRSAFETTSTDEHKRDHVYFYERDVDAPPELTIDRREVIWAAFVDAAEAIKLPLTPAVRAYLEDAVRRRGLTEAVR
jgi:ADP-ribose pyrophosphatase YjhB (NUDIX family)